MVVTLEAARRMLGYGRVTLTFRRVEHVKRPAMIAIFSAVPDRVGLPSVDIFFNEACDIVDLVSFGHWHTHCDSAGDEEENIRRAFKVAREIILGRLHIIDQYSQQGKDLGSEGHRPGQPLPRRLRDYAYAERLVFGKLPQRLMLPESPAR